MDSFGLLRRGGASAREQVPSVGGCGRLPTGRCGEMHMQVYLHVCACMHVDVDVWFCVDCVGCGGRGKSVWAVVTKVG